MVTDGRCGIASLSVDAMVRRLRYFLHRLLAVLYPEHDDRFKSPCPACNGDGRMAGNWCHDCSATGWTRSPEQLENREKWNRGELPWLPPRE